MSRMYIRKTSREQDQIKDNIIRKKASTTGVNGVERPGECSEPHSRSFWGSKEHLDWLKIDLNAAKTFNAQDYKTHKKLIRMEVHLYSNKAQSQPGNIWVKDIMATQKGQSWKKINWGFWQLMHFAGKVNRGPWVQERVLLGLNIYFWEYTWNVAATSP